jgi:hypothetical protein
MNQVDRFFFFSFAAGQKFPIEKASGTSFGTIFIRVLSMSVDERSR